jgi:hypothetical protein
MSLKQELDSLRKTHAGVDDLVYADISAQMVLYANSGDTRSQEVYDKLLGRAGALLTPDGATVAMARAIGADAGDALVLNSDGSGMVLVVRAAANPDECLIFGCRPGADVSAISQAAAGTLTRFAASGQ